MTEHWCSPGNDPDRPGVYNATVFDPTLARSAERRDAFKWRRFWNGKNWSRPFLEVWHREERADAAATPSTLTGDHRRFWWRTP